MFTSGTDYVTRVGINLGSGKGKVGTNETIHSPPPPFENSSYPWILSSIMMLLFVEGS